MEDRSSGPSPSQMRYEENFPSRSSGYTPESLYLDTLGIGAQFEENVSQILQSEQNQYQIESSCLDDGDLVVFPATSQDGTPCEAQCFRKCQLPDKLYSARKRRIQRLKKSCNLMHEVNKNGVKIIVSRISEGNPRSCRNTDTEPKNQYSCCIQEFPPLCCSSKSKESTLGDVKRAKLSGAQLSFAKAAALC
ncbi:hypothetical protein F4859DRAFT_513343 [Xylaria cf. heliscus]|nr:hypothetical protein F4859DRAFT_513343 [Xylaria cf. heliscus]